MLPARGWPSSSRQQGDACARLGSPLYAGLMAYAADDLLDGGPVAVALSGRELDPGPHAVTLRLFGAVHGLVLSGRAPDLAAYYPSVGGTADPDAAWPEFRRVCAEQLDAIRPWLESPPQTNEIGRSAALLGGVLHVAAATRLPVRLMELEASAGLNQRYLRKHKATEHEHNQIDDSIFHNFNSLLFACLTAIQFRSEPGTIPSRGAFETAASLRLTRGSSWTWGIALNDVSAKVQPRAAYSAVPKIS